MDTLFDFQSVAEQIPVGIFVVDVDRRIHFWNDWLVEKTGISREAAHLRGLDELFSYAANQRFEFAVAQAIEYQIPQLLSQTLNRYLIPIELPNASRHGLQYMQQQVKVMPLAGRDGDGYALVVVQDVTETVIRSAAMSEMMQKFKEVSLRDPLTNLYNRRFMWEWLNNRIKEAQRYGTHLACVMLDIDHFKRLNDTYGHHQGDEILKGFAHLVLTQLRESDILVRYGGEEFAGFLPKCDLEQAVATGHRILQRVRAAAVGGLDAGGITCSVGVAVYEPDAPITIEELLRRADRRLYEAKNGGRNRVVPQRAEHQAAV